MTKKDFELIAAALRDARHAAAQNDGKFSDTVLGVGYAADFLADALATTNPRFDRERFLEACRVTP